MRYTPLAATAALTLAGCAQPAINDIDDSHVRVFAPLGSNEQEISAEAARGCAVYGKRRCRSFGFRDGEGWDELALGRSSVPLDFLV